ncbi:SDR family NAD(P)-dependent oxidoreductase [Thermodesulfobacteriota bacterium]
MLKIKGSVAVITGGGSGIGEAVAKYWVAHGGSVVLGDIIPESLTRVEKEIQQTGGNVATLMCDVTKEKDNTALAELAIERFGAINLVVPSAGIIKDGLLLAITRDRKVARKMSLAQFQSVLDINLTGVFLTIRECAEQMINHGCKGLICLISSIGSLGIAGQINYSSTKAAMSVMPKVICAEFFRRNVAHRIRCVAVAPGYVGTPMVKGMNQKTLTAILENIPIQRLIEPEEVSSLIGELYRNEAINGDVYYIHGGFRIGSKG